MPDADQKSTQANIPNGGLELVLYRLGQIESKQDRQLQEDREWRRQQEARLEKLEERQNAAEVTVGRLSERLAISQVFQGIYTTVAGVIAGIIGKLP